MRWICIPSRFWQHRLILSNAYFRYRTVTVP